MSNSLEKTLLIKAYSEKFDFVEAKKYLLHKGSLQMEIIYDHMYPLLKFGEMIKIDPLSIKELKKGMLICYWRNNIIQPCIVKTINQDKSFEVLLLKNKVIEADIEEKFLLGRISNPKLSLLWRFKLFYQYQV